MKTMFDLDDVIEFNARGKIAEYSIKSCYDGPDDYYALLIPTKNDVVRICLSSKDLEAMHAKKVINHE